MDVRAQETVCELDHGVPQVDDGVAGKRAHEAPACAVVVVAAGREHLQASEAVEEEGDGAEVGVFSQRRPPVVDGLRQSLDEADVIARPLLQTVQVLQRRWR